MLTRSGLGAAVAAILLIVCGVWWRYEELPVAGAALVAALLIALWSARAPQRADVVRLVTSPRVARGDPIRAIYRVSNRSTAPRWSASSPPAAAGCSPSGHGRSSAPIRSVSPSVTARVPRSVGSSCTRGSTR